MYNLKITYNVFNNNPVRMAAMSGINKKIESTLALWQKEIDEYGKKITVNVSDDLLSIEVEPGSLPKSLKDTLQKALNEK